MNQISTTAQNNNKQNINDVKQKRMNSFYDLVGEPEDKVALVKKEAQGNQRFGRDTMQFTVEGLQRLKKDLDTKKDQGALEVVGSTPPIQVRIPGSTVTEKLKSVPNRARFASVRPPSASLKPTGPGLLSQQVSQKLHPLTLKAKDKQKAANLHKVGTSSTDVSIAASKIYASAIQKAEDAIKAQESSSSFVKSNYMNPTSKHKNQVNNKQKRKQTDARTAGIMRNWQRGATAINNDIEDVMGLESASQSEASEDEAERPQEQAQRDYEDGRQGIQEGADSSEPWTNSIQENRANEIRDLDEANLEIGTPNPQTRHQQKQMVDLFNTQNNYSLDAKSKVKFNTSEMWKTFVEQRKGQQDETARQLPIHERTPTVPRAIAADKMYSNRKLVDRNPPKEELQPETVVTIEDMIYSCRYDPADENYVFKGKRGSNWNERVFTSFGYNGNAPELVVTALNKRGCWKILDYKELVKQQLKSQASRLRARRDRSIVAEQESRGFQSHHDKPNHTAIDETIIEKCNFVWRPVNYYESVQRKIDRRMLKLNSSEPFVYNHLEVTKSLGTKSGLIKSLRQYYYTNREATESGYSEFDTTPTTFIVNANSAGPQLDELHMRFRQIQRSYPQKEKMPLKHCVNNLWLVKPTNANQGRGIQIFANWERMLSFINQRPGGTSCVVQKYIERPLLFKNRKFDIRVWAIATDRNELYFYRPGYLRTSSNQYSLDSQNLTVHLTNQCLQVKHKDTYGQHEEGNTLSYDAFQEYLDSEEFHRERQLTVGGPEIRVSVQDDLVPRMKDIVIDTFLAVKSSVNPNHRKNTFELFGYDFMVDEDFRVWLIEVNTNPYLGQPNKWTKQFVPEMVDELLQIVLDPLYPPDDNYYRNHRVAQRNYELIYAEGHITNRDYASGVTATTGRVNQRRSFAHHLLYPIKNYQVQQHQNPLELKLLREKYRVTGKGQVSNKAAFGTPQQAAKHQEKLQAYMESSFSRRKRYRPASALTRTAIVSPLRDRRGEGARVSESQSRLRILSDEPRAEEDDRKSDNQQEVEAELYERLKHEEQIETQIEAPQTKQQPQLSQEPASGVLKSNRSAKSHLEAKSVTIEDKLEMIPTLRSPRIGSGLEMSASKIGQRSMSQAVMQSKTPKPKTPYTREDILPDANQLDHFFDFLHPQATNKAQIEKHSEQNFEQLSASAETSLEFQKPETDSETNRTVIFDETAQPSAATENKLKKLVQNQVCELIDAKLEDLWSLSPRLRTHKNFIDVFLSICQNYFVEQSQEEVHDPEEMQAMVKKFEALIASDIKGSITKPKCVDILIELLKNENTFAIKDLAIIVLNQLAKISESQSILDGPTQSQKEQRKLDQSTNLKVKAKERLEPLAEYSIKAKEYLLKSQQIKKLLLVHEKFDEKERGLLEQTLINLTCVAEARGLSNSSQMLHQSAALFILTENQSQQPPAASALIVPPEMAAFRKYNEFFEKCTEIGLTSYLCSSNCLASTNEYFLKRLSQDDLVALLVHCEPTLNKPTYLKIIEKSIDMQNLKSRLRLLLKVVEDAVKVKEKKKDVVHINQNLKVKKVLVANTSSQRAKMPESVKAAVPRDVSLNKQRRNYRPQTAAVISPLTAEIKPPKPAQGATKKQKQTGPKKKKAIAEKKNATVVADITLPPQALSPKSTITLPKITNRSTGSAQPSQNSNSENVKQIQWNANMNKVSIKSAEIQNRENPLDQALEKLESMKIKLMQKVQQSEITRSKKNQEIESAISAKGHNQSK